MEWNYTPSGRDEAMGMPFDAIAKGFTLPGPHQIGSVNKKAIYREYTDATFTTLKPRPSQEAYLGVVGPILHAEVGDTIRVVFKNNAAHPYSMHPHGVLSPRNRKERTITISTRGIDKADGCVCARSDSHLHLARACPRRAWSARSELGLLAVPFALRRAARRGLRSVRWICHHAPRHGASGRYAQGCGQGIRHLLHRNQRE